jgi:hypothetical protein
MWLNLCSFAKRARPDIQTAVAFLSTRVKECGEDDYKKLRRMIQFLRATKDDFLTLSANSLHSVRWWVDASYAVHPDMKSHTGGALSLGGGVIYGTSKKQKLNTKSSTESELVGADDVMPQILWTLYLLEAQGFKIVDDVLYQDNKSSILLETNGRGSSGKRTRHIAVRYFFIADRVKSKEIRIEYCPTGMMIADYFTKPLQGVLFKKLRDMIMGNVDIVLPTSPTIPAAADDGPRGIPAVLPKQESRSVLDSVIKAGSNARVARISKLTELAPAGSKRKVPRAVPLASQKPPAIFKKQSIIAPTGSKELTSCLGSSAKTSISKEVKSKLHLTWADIARPSR